MNKYFFAFTLAFLGCAAAIAAYLPLRDPSPTLLVLLAFAGLRAARWLQFDASNVQLRAGFFNPKSSFQKSLSYMIFSIPWAAAWAAMYMYAAWLVWPAFGQALIIIAGIAGIADALSWLQSLIRWSSERENAALREQQLKTDILATEKQFRRKTDD